MSFCPKCGYEIKSNEGYCSNCGLAMTNTVNNLNQQNISTNNYNDNMMFNAYNNVQPNNNYMYNQNGVTNGNDGNKIVMLCVGVSIGLLLVLGTYFLFFRHNSDNYYFNTQAYEDDKDDIINNQTSNNQSSQPNSASKYQTVIIYDNVYEGVTINNATDAKNLIIKDSVDQKDKCPKDIQQVENELIKNYGITAVNLCEMDVDFARELGNVFKKIYAEFPSVRKSITNVTLVNGTMSNNYIAAFMPSSLFATSKSSSGYPWVIKTQILLNTSYFLNQERLQASVDDGSKSGHFPPNATIYSPVAHEMGHYLSFLAMSKYHQSKSILLVDNNNVNSFYEVVEDFNSGDFSLQMIKKAYDNYVKDTNTKLTLDEWRGTISQYALAKDNSGDYIYDETIAESFHDVYLNGDNAKDASKYIYTVLKSELEE